METAHGVLPDPGVAPPRLRSQVWNAVVVLHSLTAPFGQYHVR